MLFDRSTSHRHSAQLLGTTEHHSGAWGTQQNPIPLHVPFQGLAGGAGEPEASCCMLRGAGCMVLNASDCSYLALLVCVQQHHRPAQGQLLGFPLAPHWCMGITLAKGPGLSPGMLQSWAPCKLHNEGLFKGQSLPDACRVPLNPMKSNMDCSQGLLKCQQCDKPACYLCAWPASGLCPAVLPPAQCKAFHPWFLIPVVHLYCKASSSACKGQLIPLSCAFLATLLGGSPLLPSPWLGAQGWVPRAGCPG